jgi:hypothetical protein
VDRIKIGAGGMINVVFIRKNRTMAVFKVREKLDDFTYEDGLYYVKPEKLILKKGRIGHKPYMFYVEGISEPISIENIFKRQDDNAVLIDAQSIHDLTSTKILDVLSKNTLDKKDAILIGMSFLILILTIVSVGLSA